jgi:N-acetylglutamate synthase-like GNAT family acetyltransferase
MIRECSDKDFDAIYRVINDAAQAYKGVIPSDRWHEPYMRREHLEREITAGVAFWGVEEDSELVGVMGIQDKGDVTLIRHAYVKTALRNRGFGSRLLRHLETTTGKPILIGTWAAATWAIAFYRKHGYRLVSTDEKNELLKKYWNIPERQVETSVVLTRVA